MKYVLFVCYHPLIDSIEGKSFMSDVPLFILDFNNQKFNFCFYKLFMDGLNGNN